MKTFLVLLGIVVIIWFLFCLLAVASRTRRWEERSGYLHYLNEQDEGSKE